VNRMHSSCVACRCVACFDRARLAVFCCAAKVRRLVPRGPRALDAHNCLPLFWLVSDRIERALSAGTPLRSSRTSVVYRS